MNPHDSQQPSATSRGHGERPQGSMDNAAREVPEARLAQGGWQAPWMAAGGAPTASDGFSPPLSQAAGHYGAGYGDETTYHGYGWPPQAGAQDGPSDDEHHAHYRRLRDAHARQLDDDYAAWRRERFAGDFERFRLQRQESLAQRDEGPLESLGRAVSDAVTGSRDPDLDQLKR